MGHWFVTGGTGFIGHRLVTRLVLEGHEVTVLVRRRGGLRTPAPIHRVRGDLESFPELRPHLESCEGVLHIAGLVKARRRADYHRVNARGTNAVVAALAELKRPIRLVYLSSLAAVGPAPPGGSVDESTPPRPVSEYGRSKLAGEAFVTAAPDNVRWTILRPPAVYGPGDRALLPYFKLARRGWRVFFGDPDRRFSLIYVDDLVTSVLHVLNREESIGETYFVADPTPYTWRTVAEALIRRFALRRPRTLNVPPALLHLLAAAREIGARMIGRDAFFSRAKVREILQPSWVCSPEKIRSELGFQAPTPLEEGLRATFAWYRAHAWIR